MNKYNSLADMLSSAAAQIQLKTGDTNKIKGDDIPEAISLIDGLKPMNTIRPDFLEQGDKVAIVAGSSAGTEAMVSAAQTLFSSWGLSVTLEYYADPTSDYVGTAIKIIDAIKDTSVKAIIALRGGDGSLHIVDSISQNIIQANPKWYVGYSDVTGYLSMFINAGVQSLHGPMCSSIIQHQDDDGSLNKLHDVLFGVSGYNFYNFTDGNSSNILGCVTGRLVGGNQSTLLPYHNGDRTCMEYKDDLIVVLEETSGQNTVEYYRRLKEMKYSCGDRIKGLIIGDIPLETSSLLTGDKYSLTKDVFFDIPIAFTQKIGHGDVNWPLILGGYATLNVTSLSNATIIFDEEKVSVNYNLDNAEVIVGQNLAALNAPFKAMIAPTGHYSFGQVNVVMNDVDVTDTVWDAATGVISIASVTGDIEITISSVSLLPSTYTPVDCLVCNGSQYFNAGFKASSTMMCDVIAEGTNLITQSHNSPYGGRKSSSRERFDACISYATAYNVPLNSCIVGVGTASRWKTMPVPYSKVRVIVCDNYANIYNDSVKVAQIDFNDQSAWTGTNNVYVGCCNNNGSRINNFVGELDRMRFLGVADFIPVVRKSDNVAGMYDVIRSTFYQSTGNAFELPQ